MQTSDGERSAQGTRRPPWWRCGRAHHSMPTGIFSELRTPGAQAVVRDRKSRLCIRDRYTTTDARRHYERQDRSPENNLATDLAPARIADFRDSLATEVKEGISVEHGDNYSHALPTGGSTSLTFPLGTTFLPIPSTWTMPCSKATTTTTPQLSRSHFDGPVYEPLESGWLVCWASVDRSPP